jgi:hypothetical protein
MKQIYNRKMNTVLKFPSFASCYLCESGKMGVHWDSTSATHRLHESLWIRRQMLYTILIEFGVPKKLVRLIKMRLNETCSKVRIGKHSSDTFPTQNGLNARCLTSLFNFGNTSSGTCKKTRSAWEWMGYIIFWPILCKSSAGYQKYHRKKTHRRSYWRWSRSEHRKTVYMLQDKPIT